MKDKYNQISNWANKNAGWLILIGIIIIIAIVIIQNVSRDYLDVEKEKCNDLVIGESIEHGYLGNCELYLGSDKKTHYLYHRYYDVDDEEGKEFYIIWETGKAGKY